MIVTSRCTASPLTPSSPSWDAALTRSLGRYPRLGCDNDPLHALLHQRDPRCHRADPRHPGAASSRVHGVHGMGNLDRCLQFQAVNFASSQGGAAPIGEALFSAFENASRNAAPARLRLLQPRTRAMTGHLQDQGNLARRQELQRRRAQGSLDDAR